MMSGPEDQLEVFPFPNGSRGSSLASSVSRRKKISRIESVETETGVVLVEVEEETLSQGNYGIIIPRKDSSLAPTTMGGVILGTVVQENDGIPSDKASIQRRLTLHGSALEVNHNLDDTPDIDGKSHDSRYAQFDGFRRIFLTTTHYLHLALAAPSIVRIPHLAHKYGSKTGSAFIFAYFLCLVFVAMPICMLETTLAQFSSLGPVNMFGCFLPLVKGIGIGMMMTCSLLMLISGTTLTWSTFYLFQSFQENLPWETCPTNMTEGCKNSEALENGADLKFIKVTYIPSDYYFQNKVLQSLDMESDDPLQLNTTLAAIMFGLWAIQLALVYSRISWKPQTLSSIFAVMTLIMLISLIIHGLDLENSGRGLNDVFNLNFSATRYELAEPDLWLDCLGQAFWSLGPSIGLLITRASYNNFRKKILSEVTISVVLNLAMQYLLMIAIFPYAGHLYTSTVYKNIGYFFVMGSYAVTEGIMPHTAAVLLFLCVCENLLAHTVMLAETVAVSISENLPLSWQSGFKRFSVDFFVCAFGYLASLPFVTKDGIYYITTTDTLLPWVAGVSLGLIEVCAFTYIYGRRKIEDHYYKMQKSKTIFIWICKYFVSPALLGLLIWVAISGLTNDPISWDHLPYKREDSYFTYGLTLSLLPLGCAGLSIFYQIGRHIKNPKVLIYPSPDWASTAISCHTSLMHKDHKKRDRSKPWLVVQWQELASHENENCWIPFGYSWVPEGGAAAKILKEDRSDINTITRKIVATYLQDRFSQQVNQTKENAAFSETDTSENQIKLKVSSPETEISTVQPTSSTAQEAQVPHRKTGAYIQTLRERTWSIDRFLSPGSETPLEVTSQKTGNETPLAHSHSDDETPNDDVTVNSQTRF